MKQRFAALFLAAMLLCALLAGCGPSDVPSDPGSNGSNSPSSDTNSGSDTDNSNGGTTPDNSKPAPSIQMESCNIYRDDSGKYIIGYVFRAENRSTSYNVKATLHFKAVNASGAVKTDYTSTPYIAPGDTIRFIYLKSYSDWIPDSASYTYFDSVTYTTPAIDAATETSKIVRSSDLSAVASERKNTTSNANTFTGTVSNTSKYPSQVKVSLILKKDGKVVSVNAPTALLTVPAGGSAAFTILQSKYPAYDSYEVVAAPWNYNN